MIGLINYYWPLPAVTLIQGPVELITIFFSHNCANDATSCNLRLHTTVNMGPISVPSFLSYVLSMLV